MDEAASALNGLSDMGHDMTFPHRGWRGERLRDGKNVIHSILRFPLDVLLVKKIVSVQVEKVAGHVAWQTRTTTNKFWPDALWIDRVEEIYTVTHLGR